MRAEAFEDLLQGDSRVLGLLAACGKRGGQHLIGARADAPLSDANRMLLEQRVDARAQGHDLGFDCFVQIHRFGSFGGVAIPKVAARAGVVLAAIVPLAFALIPTEGAAA